MRRPILSVKAPATSANLGSGFDAMGMALSLYNVFDLMELLPEGEFKVEVIGEGTGSWDLSLSQENGVVKSYLAACEAMGVRCPGLWLRCHNAIPLSRGLGSSATAVVAGVLLAAEVSGRKASQEDLLELMVRLEGHPDNVVPCLLGGVVVSCFGDQGLKYLKLPQPPRDLMAVVAVPDVMVNTREARSALPKTVSFEDAVFNLGRAALLAAAWSVGRFDLLSFGMDDRLHQPYRSKLFPGGEVIMDRVKSVPGCLGVAISGSGPSVIALAKGSPSLVAQAMCGTFMEHGVRSRFFVLHCPVSGAEVRRLAGR
ncbi:homoserine kinase [Thermanaerovibrio velox DSM 12556]|uniref:Homoserine kinase n=1 Tax=Thermanaerovibrio velox DSM 12556 TaxID=926567 RepID=H0UQD1_9BACT|nr:homoserine kinase [Thermanaerovibrio velox]EHM09685.1 homoserine kinase [Thermanaerovibrio velox DSM 12556]